jgi:hypothetical protein
MPTTSRNTQSNGVSPSTSTTWSVPLILSEKAMPASCGAVDFKDYLRATRPVCAPAARPNFLESSCLRIASVML